MEEVLYCCCPFIDRVLFEDRHEYVREEGGARLSHPLLSRESSLRWLHLAVAPRPHPQTPAACVREGPRSKLEGVEFRGREDERS